MKEINLASQLNNDNLPDMRPWNSNPEGLPEWVVQETPEEVDVFGKPYKKNKTITDESNGLPKQNLVTKSAFYNEPFTFKEFETYDDMSDPYDHLMISMRTMDVHKLLEPARFQETQAEILRIRQRSDESLRDYIGRFRNETLHMTDRSDGMMTGAFIS
nr:hypothetical protein [Tanacetum cinerariifolium]